MKNFIKFASFGLLGFFMASCAETDIDYFEVTKPESIAQYEYLDSYNSLKDYINRNNTPGFTLGAGVSTSDYLNKGFYYRLVNHNFDMMTAGNEMKYASIVNDKGEMDFSTVEALVQAAEEAGMQIYGHTLCWHEQQNVKWLNSLIADLEDDEEGTIEEKQAAIIDAELDRWIGGMMDATKGYVTAWDAVNEGIMDDGRVKNQTVLPDAAKFYWAEYLGDYFVRNVVKHARKHFAEQEGADPADLKLFINDYNLEAAYNNAYKSEAMVNWIKEIESDGVTRIDGIGTQMHVTYSCKRDEQENREQAVVKMLNTLAESGKLIRITELDMGIEDENGKTINTDDVTLAQHKLMGNYYKFIISKYFEIIPKEQQFGICQWCITDAPKNSGWRKNEPVGLWNLNYQRKPAYGSFCDALKAATDNN